VRQLALSALCPVLRGARWGLVAWAWALLLASRLVTVIKWDALLRAKGMAFPYGYLLRVVWVSNFLGHFLPGAIGGDNIRMFTVARQVDRAPDAVSTVLMERITGTVSLAALAVCGGCWSFFRWGRSEILLALTLPVGLLVAGLVLLWTPIGEQWMGWGLRRLEGLPGHRFLAELHEAVRSFRDDPGPVSLSLGLSLVNQLLRVGSVFLCAQALRLPLGFGETLVLVPAILFISMLPITVAGLGVREGAFILLLRLADVGTAAAFGLSLVHRLAQIASNLPGLVFLFTHGMERPSYEQLDRASRTYSLRARLVWWRARLTLPGLQVLALLGGRWQDRRLWKDVGGETVWLSVAHGRIPARLWLPPKGIRVPAVVLVHGSHGPLGLYGLLSHGLSRLGIAVLAPTLHGFDGSRSREASGTPEPFTGCGEVAAAAAFLRAHPRVDGHRVSLLGHSFGGSVVTAAAGQDPHVHTVIALGPTRRVEQRVVGPQAADRLLWRTRFALHRGLPSVPSEAFIIDLTRTLALEYHLESWQRPGHPPLLLIDGEREPAADRRFLEGLAHRLTPPAAYRTLPGADHYLNSASWGRWVCYDRRAVETCIAWITGWIVQQTPVGTPSPARLQTVRREI